MRDLIREGTHIARINDLLKRIKAKLPELEELLVRIEDHWGEEDGVYRFYHQSFKVFNLQDQIREAFKLIEQIGGETDPPNKWFCRIVKEGTEHESKSRRKQSNGGKPNAFRICNVTVHQPMNCVRIHFGGKCCGLM